MDLSVTGLAVCAVLAAAGWLMGSLPVVGLLASMAFGTTSAVTLSALGGSSPLISAVFSAVLVGAAIPRRAFAPVLLRVFASDWVPAVVAGTVAYAAASAVIMPRLFAGATSAFVTGRVTGVVEVSLAPNGGNVTQTGYFVLGALTFFCLLPLLSQDGGLAVLRRGFLVWAATNAVGGAVDLAAKGAGAGDVFLPLRTATFVYLTDVDQAGFARINGLYSEASAFAAAALPSLAFTYAYWRRGGSRLALLLAAALLVLLLLSTSTTAYLGLTALALPTVASAARSLARGRVERADLLLLAAVAVTAVCVVVALIVDGHALDSVRGLFQAAILDKSHSESGRERSYWNERSLASLLDTWGLGIGFGSGRASNWLVALLSQLGVIGTLLQVSLILPFLRRLRAPATTPAARDVHALHDALRACALTSLVAGVLAGASADPGILFFVALAGVLACRTRPSPDGAGRRPTVRAARALPATVSLHPGPQARGA